MLHFPQMPHHHHHQDDDDDYEDDHVLMSLCPHVLILISSSSYLQIISFHRWHLLWTSIKFNLQHLGISIVFTKCHWLWGRHSCKQSAGLLQTCLLDGHHHNWLHQPDVSSHSKSTKNLEPSRLSALNMEQSPPDILTQSSRHVEGQFLQEHTFCCSICSAVCR